MKISPLIQFNVTPVENKNITTSVSFKQIQLTPQDEEMAQEVINNDLSLTENQNNLFKIFDKYIQSLARQKTKFCYSYEDLLQNMYLTFFNSIKELSGDNVLSKLCEILDNFKPSKEDKWLDFSTTSLSTPIQHTNLTLEGILTKNDVRTAASKKNDEELEPVRKKLDNLINSTKLSNIEVSVFECVKKGMSITQISNELALSRTPIRRHYQTCIAKMQQNNEQLPQTFDIWAENFINSFPTNQSRDEIVQLLVNNPYLLITDITKIKEDIKKIIEKFKNEGLTTSEYLNACKKVPTLFCRSPETIEQNVRGLVEKFEKDGLTTSEYLNACKKQPSLFCQSPKTIERNV